MDPALRPGQTALQSRAQRLFVPLICVMVLSLGLQVAGFAAPGWVIIKFGVIEAHIGLWIVRVCLNDHCQTKSIDEVDTFNVLTNGLTEYRVETALALVLLVTAMVVAIFIRRPGKVQLVSYMVMMLTLVSGILAMIAACKLGDDTRKSHELLGLLSPFKVPYALIMTGTGGLFCIFICFIVAIFVKPCSSEPAPVQGYPMTSQPGYAPQPYHAQPYPSHAYPAQPYAAPYYPDPSQTPQAYGYQPHAAQKYSYGNKY